MKFLGVMGLLCIAAILFFVFYKPQLKIVFQVVNVASDTTFKNPIGHKSDTYARNLAVRAIGETDSPTEVFVTDPTHGSKFLSAQLPTGKFDTTWTGEYYEKQADVVFLHKKARKGAVKVLFRYLTPDGDTLVDK
ncbi:MAG: hypothetical protein EOO88_57535 [Pedobacter sp.]|nr:MAG: hypothetical protein EOO88_57535 [Pedobacter sp.]